MGEPNQYRKLHPDPPPAATDDHLENHLLNEENRRLKDELRRVESALHTASKLMRSIDGVLGPYANRRKP